MLKQVCCKILHFLPFIGGFTCCSHKNSQIVLLKSEEHGLVEFGQCLKCHKVYVRFVTFDGNKEMREELEQLTETVKDKQLHFDGLVSGLKSWIQYREGNRFTLSVG